MRQQAMSRRSISASWAPLASGSGGRDNTIRLWSVADGRLLRTLDHTSPVYSVVFSPDGETLASGGGDRTIRLWGAP